MDVFESCIVQFALRSRLWIIFLQIVANLCIPDHDADAFLTLRQENQTYLDYVISFFLGGFARWDAQYFLHIAQFGYTYENTLAFFPLFPCIVRTIKYILPCFMSNVISDFHCLLLIGSCMNVFLFTLSALLLYRLSLLVLKSKELSLLAALLFCINPASIFFSAFYSESTFCAVTFLGFYYLEKRKLGYSVVALALSTCARSNGILSVGFIIHAKARNFVSEAMCTCHNYYTKALVFIVSSFVTAFMSFLCLLPFISYQFYAFLLFCSLYVPQNSMPLDVVLYAKTQGYKLPSESKSDWCAWTFPFSYSYVQKQYWNVGFLDYFEMKKLPNFMLAAPMLIIIIGSSLKYINQNRKFICCLGLFENIFDHGSSIYMSEKCFVHFAHVFAFSLFSMFFINVEVCTRILSSSSPVVYWVVASLLVTSSVKVHEFIALVKKDGVGVFVGLRFLHQCAIASNIYGKLSFYYFVTYACVGTISHVNFLPWT